MKHDKVSSGNVGEVFHSKIDIGTSSLPIRIDSGLMHGRIFCSKLNKRRTLEFSGGEGEGNFQNFAKLKISSFYMRGGNKFLTAFILELLQGEKRDSSEDNIGIQTQVPYQYNE
jgi:hypothetical protein